MKTNIMNRIICLLALASFVPSMAFAADAAVCYKNSYGRGVGTIPAQCGAGQKSWGFSCLSDPECPQGFDFVAGTCWAKCPKDTDIGLACLKTGGDIRTRTGFAHIPFFGIDGYKNCREKNPGKDCENVAGMIYPKC